MVMSRTIKHKKVRCSYCGHIFAPRTVKRWRDGRWYCAKDTGLQAVRVRADFLSHRVGALFEARYPRRGMLSRTTNKECDK